MSELIEAYETKVLEAAQLQTRVEQMAQVLQLLARTVLAEASDQDGATNLARSYLEKLPAATIKVTEDTILIAAEE